MKKFSLTMIFALAMALGWPNAHAHHPREAQVEVWTAQCHDDACEDEHLEVFLRLSKRGYVTVYQIMPYGRVEILYPLAHHYQHELRPDRIYRLTDLAEDVYLHDEEEGDAQIGVIYTPEAVELAPWLERGFADAGLVISTGPIVYAHVDFPRIFARVEADIRIRLGRRCNPVFVVRPVYVRPSVVCRRTDWGPRRWRPHPHYGKRDHRKRDRDERPREREERKPERRKFGRRGTEVRQIALPSQPAERQAVPVPIPSKPAHRERKQATKQLQTQEAGGREAPPRRASHQSQGMGSASALAGPTKQAR